MSQGIRAGALPDTVLRIGVYDTGGYLTMRYLSNISFHSLLFLLRRLFWKKAWEEEADLGPTSDALRNSQAKCLLREGRNLLAQGKLDEADATFAAALKKDPYVVWSLSRQDQQSLIRELGAVADRLNVAKLISQLQKIQKPKDLTRQRQS